MTEDEARSAMDRIVAELGDGWRTAEDEDRSGALKRCRLGYGRIGSFYMTFCHGNTWRDALEDFVKVSRYKLLGNVFPDYLTADSAEELCIRIALLPKNAEKGK